jgi:hypothetical protein
MRSTANTQRIVGLHYPALESGSAAMKKRPPPLKRIAATADVNAAAKSIEQSGSWCRAADWPLRARQPGFESAA